MRYRLYMTLGILCLLAIVIILSYRQGVIDERKRWQYCEGGIKIHLEEDRK